MNPGILVFTRDQDLLFELGNQLEDKHPIVPCETLDNLPERLKSQPIGAVLVHLDRTTLNGYSPARFIAELDEAIESAPMYGLMTAECPPRLRKLAEKTVDDCLEFPLDYGRLRRLLSDPQDLDAELAGFWNEMPHKELHGRSRSLVTFTPEMFDMMDEIKVAARHNVTVLLIGETGCGKTFLAKLIHELSDRRDDRLCTVACGALPPDLIESELFGYVKGAFTGADRDREGKFAAAGRGTLLLDEIDVLPPEQQAKLLRVIETGEYEPVGSNETQYSQARLIVASNYNLEELVRAGSFRTDLYYRLNILNFRLLALRHRPWDIEYLVRKFALEHSRTHGIQLRSIEPAFLETLRAYHWPGNIREMENVVRRAVLYCHRGVLTVGDLPSSIRAAVGAGHMSPDAAMHDQAAHTAHEDRPIDAQLAAGTGPRVRVGSLPTQPHAMRPVLPMHGLPHANHPSPFHSAAIHAPHAYEPAIAGATATASARLPQTSLEARVDVLERRIIEDCLQRNNHRRKETAAELGISRVTLYNKMKKFGLM
ncbi:MAG: sigma-54 dependent transcriptional regulator [Planctomycetaceae bacterium]|nr:sigma-54 dependent transcriptional regulator [Planctomycetaceae bacterium]